MNARLQRKRAVDRALRRRHPTLANVDDTSKPSTDLWDHRRRATGRVIEPIEDRDYREEWSR